MVWSVTTLALALAPLARPLAAEPTEAFRKGQADGKSFGERMARKKGAAEGRARGLEEGFRKGYEDARVSAPPSPAPGPAPSPDPGPAPSPDPGPAPSPDPGPAPSPDPGPAPSPDPGPAPSPDPSPAPPDAPPAEPPASPADPAPPAPAPDPQPPGDAPPAPPPENPAEPPPPAGDTPPPAADTPPAGGDVPGEPPAGDAPPPAGDGGTPQVQSGPAGSGTRQAAAPDARPVDRVATSGPLARVLASSVRRAGAPVVAPEAEETPEEEALRRYPDLIPPARARAALAPSETSAPAGRAATGEAIVPGFTPEEIAYGQDYTKGFGVGYLEAYAKTYGPARDEAYQQAFQEGHARGMAEYRRLSSHSDGSPFSAEASIDLARKAILLGRFEEAINRLDILIASEGSTAVLDQALYHKAAAYYHWGRMERALEAARVLVTQMPRSGFADDGYFLMGAAWETMRSGGFLGMFGRRRDVEAIEAYTAVVTQYPGSTVVPQALLRLGGCHERQRQKASAIQAYRRVVTDYAASPEAVRARARLAALGAGE
jgi:TolA-binding protein